MKSSNINIFDHFWNANKSVFNGISSFENFAASIVPSIICSEISEKRGQLTSKIGKKKTWRKKFFEFLYISLSFVRIIDIWHLHQFQIFSLLLRISNPQLFKPDRFAFMRTAKFVNKALSPRALSTLLVFTTDWWKYWSQCFNFVINRFHF